MNLHDDIVTAQKLIEGRTTFIKHVNFHEYSAVYTFSNEDLYNEYFKTNFKTKAVLTVTASGDQTLEAILRGSKKIDTFDISSFTKYYLKLKIAAIKSLTKDEFISFFITSENIFDIDLYEKIRKELDRNDLLFWDSLFDYFEPKRIYNSRIFSMVVPYSNNYIIKYEELKSLIDKAIINSYDCNITNITDFFKTKYDVIILSNILQYAEIFNINNTNEEILKFILKVSNLLNNNGIMLAHYLFNLSTLTLRDFCGDSNLDYFLTRNDFELQKFNNRGVLVYKK